MKCCFCDKSAIMYKEEEGNAVKVLCEIHAVDELDDCLITDLKFLDLSKNEEKVLTNWM